MPSINLCQLSVYFLLQFPNEGYNLSIFRIYQAAKYEKKEEI